MHGNRRYVKSRQIGVGAALLSFLVALLPAAPARAEIVTSARSEAVLAVGRDGLPRVAYVAAGELHVATRRSDGWQDEAVEVGIAVRAGGIVVDGRGRVSVLVQDASKILLVRRLAGGWRIDRAAPALPGRKVGLAGIGLDARGLPAVAYGLQVGSTRATFLRIATVGRRGRLVTAAITRGGFPSSPVPPAAAPVLVRGHLHVVEAYAAAAIEWQPDGRRWVGQFLFDGRIGSISGRVLSIAVGSDTFTATALASPQLTEGNHPQACPQNAKSAVEMLIIETSANCGQDISRPLDRPLATP